MCLKIDFQSHNQCLLYYLFGLLVVGALSLFWLAALWEMVGHLAIFHANGQGPAVIITPCAHAQQGVMQSGRVSVCMYVCMYVCVQKIFLNHTLAAISNRETMVEG